MCTSITAMCIFAIFTYMCCDYSNCPTKYCIFSNTPCPIEHSFISNISLNQCIYNMLKHIFVMIIFQESCSCFLARPPSRLAYKHNQRLAFLGNLVTLNTHNSSYKKYIRYNIPWICQEVVKFLS